MHPSVERAIGAAPPDGAAPPHHIELADEWSLWRLAALRSAGMPMAWLDAFAAPGGDAAADTEDAARAASAAAVRGMVGRPAFVEAVTWQNPALVHNWLGRYAAEVASSDTPRLSRRDQREALVAFLAQRYCAKNETIGFFGPVAWGRFVDDEVGLTTVGAGGLRSRSTYIEGWAADAVAAAFAADPRVAGELPVRRHPVCDVDAHGVLRRPRQAPEQLDEPSVRLWRAMDRPRSRAALVADCLPAGLSESDQADQRKALDVALDTLCARGIAVADLPVPVAEHPQRWLRQRLAQLSDPELSRELSATLDDLEAAVDAVRTAAGDPPALLTALGGLDDAFNAVTGRAGQRDKPRQRYGRALVYEDCRRDFDVTVGADLLDELRAPLAILLDTARWFVAETGAEVERDLIVRYRQLADGGPEGMALCDLVLASGDILNGRPGTAVERVAEDFAARWAELHATATGSPPVLRSATLRPLVTALFPAAPAPWQAARQHAPDAMLRMVPGPAGPRPQWVLGELHLALNTLENRPFVTQADDRAEVLAATAADFAAGRIVPVYPKDSPEVTSRTYPPPAMDIPDRYIYWSHTRDSGHAATDAVLPGAGLRVHVDDVTGRLVVRPPSGEWQGTALEFLGEFLTALVVNRFQLRPAAAHQPRLLLDDAVVARETWRVPVGEVPVPASGADYRHQQLRDWLAARGMPRWLFVKAPRDPKPYLLDCAAPLSLRNFARAVRREQETDPATLVQLVEMLPAPDELWLRDAQGHGYTSEFRMVAVDAHRSYDPVLSRR